MASETEEELMIESCQALLISMFGESNWQRWNDLKQKTQYCTSFQSFLSWMLDIASDEILKETKTGQCLEMLNEEADVKFVKTEEIDSEQLTADQCLYSKKLMDNVVSDGGVANESELMHGNTYCPNKGQLRGTMKSGQFHEYIPEEADDVDNEILDPEDDIEFYADGEMVQNTDDFQFDNSTYYMELEAKGRNGGEFEESNEKPMVMITYDHEAKLFYCETCHMALTSAKAIKQHCLKHGSQDTILLYCTCCGENFSSLESVAEHVAKSSEVGAEQVRAKPNRPYNNTCATCLKAFSTRRILKQHALAVHQSAEPRFHCGKCGKKFRWSNHMYRHRKRCTVDGPV